MAAPLFVVAVFLVACATSTYTLTDNFSGTTFFNNWNFFTSADPTHGTVTYVNQTTAQSQGLISTTTNAPAVYIGADHTNVVTGGRNSVRIVSNKAYNGGLFLIDLLHMPAGCGTWPAFWMTSSSATWPTQGEIDIIEGVNLNTVNSMTLHTTTGCNMASVSTSTFTGKWSANTVGGSSSNCDVNAANQSSNAGCGVQASGSNTYGTPFNNNKGGVYATEWVNSATGWIKIWFFPRNSIPADITAGTPNPSGWGTPQTNFQFSSSYCPYTHFANQNIIFDLTFCGDWAGNVFSSSGCSGTCSTYVQQNPSAFAQAYWSINYVKAFSGSSTTTTTKTCTTYANTDVGGGDFSNAATATSAACCTLCEQTSGCVAWAYNGVCYMKNSSNTGLVTGKTGVTAGIISSSFLEEREAMSKERLIKRVMKEDLFGSAESRDSLNVLQP